MIKNAKRQKWEFSGLDAYFLTVEMEALRMGNENKTDGCRERARCKCLSPHKHGVLRSSHMWNYSSDRSHAPMEINQSDITPTLVTGQHRFLSTRCISRFCHLNDNLPLQIWILPMFVTLLSHPVFPTLALVASPPITNATPLMRCISPPFSHPLPHTLFAQEWEWKRKKGCVCLWRRSSYSSANINVKHEKSFKKKNQKVM